MAQAKQTSAPLRAQAVTETVFGLSLIASGVIFLTVALWADAWIERVSEGDGRRTILAKLVPIKGRVRSRPPHSSTWMDVTRAIQSADGDSISTGESGVATLTFTDGTVAQIAPNSLIHLERPKLSGEASLLDKLRTPAPPPQLVVTRGSIDVSLSETAAAKPTAAPAIFAGGRKLDLHDPDSDQPRAKTLRITDKGDSSASNTPIGVPQKTAARLDPLSAPKILAPFDGTAITAGPNGIGEVRFRWEPANSGGYPEFDLSREHGGRIEPSAVGWSGASARLRNGNFQWRVRFTRDGEEGPWSPTYSVTVLSASEKSPPPITALRAAKVEAPLPDEVRRQMEVERQERAEVEALEAGRRAKAEQSAAELRRERLEARRRAEEIAEAERRNEAQRKLASEERERLLNEKYGLVRESASKKTGIELPDSSGMNPKTTFDEIPGQSASDGGKGSRSANSYAEGRDLSTLLVQLRWNPLPEVREYRVLVFKNEEPFSEEKTSKPEHSLALKSYDPGDSYAYRIEARLKSGRSIASRTRGIEIDLSPPGLTYPEENADRPAGAKGEFTWSKTALTVNYEFQVSTTPSFQPSLMTLRSEENFVSVKVERAGTYYWRVKAHGARFETGWSAPRTIQIREKTTKASEN